jgi:hypothetical protein
LDEGRSRTRRRCHSSRVKKLHVFGRSYIEGRRMTHEKAKEPE